MDFIFCVIKNHILLRGGQEFFYHYLDAFFIRFRMPKRRKIPFVLQRDGLAVDTFRYYAVGIVDSNG